MSQQQYQFQDHAKDGQPLISLTKKKESFHSNGELDDFLELLRHSQPSLNIWYRTRKYGMKKVTQKNGACKKYKRNG